MADFKWFDDGSVTVVTPECDEAQGWLDDNVMTPETLTWGRGIVVEPRYLNGLIRDIVGAGFTIEEE